MYFDIVPGKTIAKRGKKTVTIRTTGLEKRHITVVLGCTATGDFLPPMIIFKGTIILLLLAKIKQTHYNRCVLI